MSRLVVLGHADYVTLEALRWLADLGISFVQIDKDGRVLATSAPGSGDARLRRMQALATTNGSGPAIARMILTEKLKGQQLVLESLAGPGGSHDLLRAALERLEAASTVEEMVIAERDAAFVYWSAWARVTVRFRRSDIPRTPEHWHTFGQRSSPFTSAPRLAVNPANALLNYLYAILEAETRIACLTVGLDPALGIIHVDYRSRDSFALDLMEAARPRVDAYVLELLRERTFRASDFFETRRGVCRLLPPMTALLAKTACGWADVVAPFAERVAQMLSEAPGSRIDRLATPLTNANRHSGRETLRRRPRPAQKLGPEPPTRTCRRCGGPVPHIKRVYCDECLPHFQREQLERAGVAQSPVGTLKARGGDSTHGGKAAEKRGASIAERKRELKEWDERYGKLIDLRAFEREILPLIQSVPLSRLMRATGLSLRYVSQIRRGEKTPHPRHWDALRSVGASASGASVEYLLRDGSGEKGGGLQAQGGSAPSP